MDSGMQISKQNSSWWVVVIFCFQKPIVSCSLWCLEGQGWGIGKVLHFYSTFTLRKPFIHIVYRKSLVYFLLLVADDIKLYQSHGCFMLNETETTPFGM